MRRAAVIVGLLLALSAGIAHAQDVRVDVRGWNGQTWQLSSPSLEVFYTVVPPPVPGTVAAPTISGTAASAGATSTTIAIDPGFRRPPEGYALSQGPAAKQGQRQHSTLTLVKSGVESRVPIGSITTLTFTRQPVANSFLPAHLARDDFRYAATAVLTDGSQIAGDYVNLGTAVLRGTTPQGTVDIPWQQIETLRFQR
jgi:hypothetical protein